MSSSTAENEMFLKCEGRYVVEVQKVNDESAEWQKRYRFQHPQIYTRDAPNFAASVVASLQQHSYALIQMDEGEKKAVETMFQVQLGIFPPSGPPPTGAVEAKIPVDGDDDVTTKLPALADHVLEGIFVDIFEKTPDEVRKELGPCFTSKGCQGAALGENFLTFTKRPQNPLPNTAAKHDSVEGLFTLYLSDCNVGLQIFDPVVTDWVDVECAGCVVLMAGSLLAYAAPGVLEQCRYRVHPCARCTHTLSYQLRPARQWPAVFPRLRSKFLPEFWRGCASDSVAEMDSEDSSSAAATTAGELMDQMKEATREEPDLPTGEVRLLPPDCCFFTVVSERRKFVFAAEPTITFGEIVGAFAAELSKRGSYENDLWGRQISFCCPYGAIKGWKDPNEGLTVGKRKRCAIDILELQEEDVIKCMAEAYAVHDMVTIIKALNEEQGAAISWFRPDGEYRSNRELVKEVVQFRPVGVGTAHELVEWLVTNHPRVTRTALLRAAETLSKRRKIGEETKQALLRLGSAKRAAPLPLRDNRGRLLSKRKDGVVVPDEIQVMDLGSHTSLGITLTLGLNIAGGHSVGSIDSSDEFWG